MIYKLPEGWREAKLGEVTDKIFSGGTPRTKEASFWDGDYNWMSSGETRLDYINNTEKTITLKGIQESSTKEALKGDVVIASAGQGKTRGQTSFLNINTYINQSIISLRANNNYLYNKFLLFNLRSRYSELRGISDGHSIRGSITTKMMKDFPIKLPTMTEQKVIADTLSSLDDKIELNNKINENLEQQAQSIFKHWFIDFEFPDENGNPYKSSGGEMIESELGMIPKGWEVKKIKETSKDIVFGKTPKTTDKENFGGDMPFLTIPDMHNKLYVDNTERTLTEKGINTQANKTVPKNSVCVSCIATPGLVSITKEATQTNQQINTIVPKIEYTYVYSLMKSLSNKIILLGSGGTATNNLNKTQFSNIDIVVPSHKHRSVYHKLVETLFDMILINQEQNQKLSKLRDTLLPKLMSGEIRIPLD